MTERTEQMDKTARLESKARRAIQAHLEKQASKATLVALQDRQDPWATQATQATQDRRVLRVTRE